MHHRSSLSKDIFRQIAIICEICRALRRFPSQASVGDDAGERGELVSGQAEWRTAIVDVDGAEQNFSEVGSGDVGIGDGVLVVCAGDGY